MLHTRLLKGEISGTFSKSIDLLEKILQNLIKQNMPLVCPAAPQPCI